MSYHLVALHHEYGNAISEAVLDEDLRHVSNIIHVILRNNEHAVQVTRRPYGYPVRFDAGYAGDVDAIMRRISNASRKRPRHWTLACRT